jgi:hypothetical protein
MELLPLHYGSYGFSRIVLDVVGSSTMPLSSHSVSQLLMAHGVSPGLPANVQCTLYEIFTYPYASRAWLRKSCLSSSPRL